MIDWKNLAPEAFRAAIETLTRAEREELHGAMRSAIEQDEAAVHAALVARASLVHARRKLTTLGTLTAATRFDRDGKPVGRIEGRYLGDAEPPAELPPAEATAATAT